MNLFLIVYLQYWCRDEIGDRWKPKFSDTYKLPVSESFKALTHLQIDKLARQLGVALEYETDCEKAQYRGSWEIDTHSLDERRQLEYDGELRYVDKIVNSRRIIDIERRCILS